MYRRHASPRTRTNVHRSHPQRARRRDRADEPLSHVARNTRLPNPKATVVLEAHQTRLARGSQRRQSRASMCVSLQRRSSPCQLPAKRRQPRPAPKRRTNLQQHESGTRRVPLGTDVALASIYGQPPLRPRPLHKGVLPAWVPQLQQPQERLLLGTVRSRRIGRSES